MTVLMLDAAFPPNPNQWVADMNAVGAQAGAVYVYDPGLQNYTLQHIEAAVAANKLLLPIVVPGNVGPDPNAVLGMLRNLGFTNGPVAIDLEPGSLPSPAWDSNFDSVMKNNGFTPIEYGTQSRFGKWGGPYTDNDELWIASWIRTGVLNPIPALPVGDDALQFVNDIKINGNTYDASVVNESIFTGVNMAQLDDIESILKNGTYPGQAKEAWIVTEMKAMSEGWSGTVESVLPQLVSTVNALKTEVDNLVATGAVSSDSPLVSQLLKLGNHLGIDLTK